MFDFGTNGEMMKEWNELFIPLRHTHHITNQPWYYLFSTLPLVCSSASSRLYRLGTYWNWSLSWKSEWMFRFSFHLGKRLREGVHYTHLVPPETGLYCNATSSSTTITSHHRDQPLFHLILLTWLSIVVIGWLVGETEVKLKWVSEGENIEMLSCSYSCFELLMMLIRILLWWDGDEDTDEDDEVVFFSFPLRLWDRWTDVCVAVVGTVQLRLTYLCV